MTNAEIKVVKSAQLIATVDGVLHAGIVGKGR